MFGILILTFKLLIWLFFSHFVNFQQPDFASKMLHMNKVTFFLDFNKKNKQISNNSNAEFNNYSINYEALSKMYYK